MGGQPFINSYNQYKGYHKDGKPYKADEWSLARSITTGEVVEAEEIKVIHEDGTQKVLSVSSTPIKDKNERIIMGVVIAADITKICK